MIKSNFAIRTLFGGILILVLGGSTLIAPSKAEADVIGSTECFPAVLMLKGSGEGTTDGTVNGPPVDVKTYTPINSSTGEPFIKTNGHEGVILGRLLQSFVNSTDPSKTVSKVRFIGIETPSLPVFPSVPEAPAMPGTSGSIVTAGANSILAATAWTDHIIKYNQSYRTGAQMVVDTIKADEDHNCNTRYMLLSYSQGVISARLAMNLLGNDTSKVISSYVMGDPFQKADGASSDNQFTDANTSRDTEGTALSALNMFIEMGKGGGFFTKSLVDGLSNYKNEMTRSDSFIYRNDVVYGDEGEERIVSRSLCHKKDPTCSFSEISISEHMNYFDHTEAAGKVDISLEVSEFDKQVQVLANSKKTDPRERTLTKSPSLSGEITSYNVANAQPDDKCSWDENSDGSLELVNVPCGIHNVTHTGDSAKMTVTVTDSFGITYPPLTSEVKTVDPKVVEKISSLDPETWYEFRPYYKPIQGAFDPGSCLSWQQSHDTYIDASNSYLKSLRCNDKYAPTNLDLSTQNFRTILHATPNGDQVRIVSGYDDSYTWEASDSSDEVKISPINESSSQNFVPTLAVIKDQPYYTFSLGDKCVTGSGDNIYLQPCNSSNIYQLFSARPTALYTSGQFGRLSIEKEVTPPSTVTGVKIEMDMDKVNLVWNHSVDARSKIVNYLIYKKNYIPNVPEAMIIPEYLITTGASNFFAFSLSGVPSGQKYSYYIYAVDYAGNKSAPGIINFSTPVFVPKPMLPVATVSSDKTGVKISFPYSSSIPPWVTAVGIYVDGTYVATVPRTSSSGEIARYIDKKIPQDTSSRQYSYEYQMGGPSITSVKSDNLQVILR